MATRFKYVRGDTGPHIQVKLTESDSDTPVDLTGGSVTLHFREAGEDTVLLSRAFTLLPATQADGVAVLEWQVGDLDVEPGAYEGEIEVVRASGVRETLYDRLRFRVRDDFA